MSAEPVQVDEQWVADGPKATDAGKKREREKSGIDFPYLSLDVAIEIVQAVHSAGGQSCRIEQAAAHLDEKPNTGPFRNKLSTARMFGLLNYSYSAGTITLTPLGSQIPDPDQEKRAKAESFLQVPLYRRLYDEYKGVLLPPTSQALEGAMVSMGVSVKQKDKARQAFQRSAQEAGFFAYGTTKLVYPSVGGPSITGKPKDADPKPDPAANGGSGGNGGGGDDTKKRHPFIEGLLETLPPAQLGVAKTEWTLQGRQDWLQTAAGIFNLIYKAATDDTGGSLSVSVTRPTTTSAN